MKCFACLIMFFVAFALQSCTTNISGDARYPTGFVEGHCYVVRQDLRGVALRNAFGGLNGVEILTAGGAADSERLREEMVSIPQGTRIQVTKVMLTHDIENGTEFYLLAEFASGPYKGKSAYLERISDHKKFDGAGMFGSLVVRDPEYLEEQNEPNKVTETTHQK